MTSETPLANVLPEDLSRVLPHYLGETTPAHIEPVSTGHIHNSWRVDLPSTLTLKSDLPTLISPSSQHPTPSSLFLQQLNTTVFTDPEAVMHNIATVTTFLNPSRSYHQGKNSGPEYEHLTLIPTTSGSLYLRLDEIWWRAFEFKTGLVSHQTLSSPEMAYEAGKAFAGFAKSLQSLDPTLLRTTIQDFHSLSWRSHQLEKAVLQLPNRADSVAHLKSMMDEIKPLIEDAHEYVKRLLPLEKAWSTGEIPTRITHNDSKLNNLLFDPNGKARCVVDLDTVMPGIVHFDIGDSLRSMSVNLTENDPNASALRIHEERMSHYLKGYLEGNWLTKSEEKYIPYAAPYMACIMGVRFLTDYAEGNRYFKVDYPSHNLVRARNQLMLTRLFLAHSKLP